MSRKVILVDLGLCDPDALQLSLALADYEVIAIIRDKQITIPGDDAVFRLPDDYYQYVAVVDRLLGGITADEAIIGYDHAHGQTSRFYVDYFCQHGVSFRMGDKRKLAKLITEESSGRPERMSVYGYIDSAPMRVR